MQKTIEQLSKELNLSKEAILNAYKAYWKFIREKISSLPLKKNLHEDDFNKLRTNFNLPSLGKLSCNYDRWQKIRTITKYNIENDQYKKSETDV